MARYTTRVQLDGRPSEENYNDLHRAMKRKGFSRFITANSTTYRLPHAEYDRETERTTDQVRDDARAAAESVWSDVQVLVTKADGPRFWSGLKKATPNELANA